MFQFYHGPDQCYIRGKALLLSPPGGSYDRPGAAPGRLTLRRIRYSVKENKLMNSYILRKECLRIMTIFKPRVALISRYYFPNVVGGVENTVANLGNELEKKGYRITVLTQSQDRFLESEFLKISTLSVSYLKSFLFEPISTFRSFEVIHIHNYTRLITDKLLTDRHFSETPRVILTLHGGLWGVGSLPNSVGKTVKILHDKLFPKVLINEFVDKVVALSQEEKMHLKLLGVEESKIEIIPNGVPDSYFNEPTIVDNPAPLMAGDSYVLTLARLDPLKRLEDVIVNLKYLPTTFKYVIAGSGSEIYKRKLLNLIEELGLCSRVLFLGTVSGSHKHALIKNCAFFVLPSSIETQSIAVMEAMALAKPVICTNVGSMKELITDGVTGFLYESGDIVSLREKMQLLINDKQESYMLGKRAREAVGEYRWSKVAERYGLIYSHI